MTSDVAILHDQLVTRGGAERVAFEMARTFDAPILAGAIEDEDEVVPDDVDATQVFNSRVGKRMMRSHYLLQDLYQMQAWQHIDEAYEYDTIIINKTNPGWFIPRDKQTTVWYLHSTPRGLYDQFHRQGGDWKTRLLKTPMRPLYAPQTRLADAWACNSELVQRRLDRYWDVEPHDVNVIYPPVPTSEFDPGLRETSDYYVTVSRLHGHKRVDEIVAAFNELNRSGGEYRLVVAGDGPERDALEAQADPGVEIRGYVSESEKRELLAGAKGFVFAAENEDFGIAPVEALAAGTPVIGISEGYTQHQIVGGKNGYTFARKGGQLRETIRYFDRRGVGWTPTRIAAFADRFSAERFRERMREVVADAREAARVEPAWRDDIDAVDSPTRGDEAEPAVTDGGGW